MTAGGSPDPDRDAAVAAAMLRLTATLVRETDVLEVLDGISLDCVDLFADAAGLLLGDGRGAVRLVASSHDDAPVVELFELQSDDGPCLDCIRTNAPVVAGDLADPDVGRRWPRFTARAVAEGYHAAHALPMRMHSQAIGALNLLRADPGRLPDADLRAAQALADVATLGLLAEPTRGSPEAVVEQLRVALVGRAVIEQAKGVLAERGRVAVADAADRLRHHARRTGQRLTDVARGVIDGSLDALTVLAP